MSKLFYAFFIILIFSSCTVSVNKGAPEEAVALNEAAEQEEEIVIDCDYLTAFQAALRSTLAATADKTSVSGTAVYDAELDINKDGVVDKIDLEQLFVLYPYLEDCSSSGSTATGSTSSSVGIGKTAN